MRTTLTGPIADTLAGATAEAVLKACVHCGMCNATCPTFQLTGDELDGPRGRIYLIKSALEGEPVTRTTQLHLDRCLVCRSCETTCPSGVEYHRLLDIGRPFVDAQLKRPWRERLLRWGIRWVATVPARLRLAIMLGRTFRPLLPTALKAKVDAFTPLPPRGGVRGWGARPAGAPTAPNIRRAVRRLTSPHP